MKNCFIISILILLTIASCIEDKNYIVNPEQKPAPLDTVPSPDILPKSLKVGNIWIYKIQYYDDFGKIIFSGFDTAQILALNYFDLIYRRDYSYKKLLPVYTEYHSISPKDTIEFHCIRDLFDIDNPNYFVYSSTTRNPDLFEDYQPYPKYNNFFTNRYTNPTNCSSCLSWGVKKFVRNGNDTASAMYEANYVRDIQLSWDKYLKLDGYYVNHRLFVVDTVVNVLTGIDKLNSKINKYLCEQYYARDIGLIKYRYYKINEYYKPTLLVASDLVKFYEAE